MVTSSSFISGNQKFSTKDFIWTLYRSSYEADMGWGGCGLYLVFHRLIFDNRSVLFHFIITIAFIVCFSLALYKVYFKSHNVGFITISHHQIHPSNIKHVAKDINVQVFLENILMFKEVDSNRIEQLSQISTLYWQGPSFLVKDTITIITDTTLFTKNWWNFYRSVTHEHTIPKII